MTKYAVVAIAALLLVPSVATAQDGRWKLGGDGSCYWDQYDGGPNQCEPPVLPQEVIQGLGTLADIVDGGECTDDQGATGRWILVDRAWACTTELNGLASATAIAATYLYGSFPTLDAIAMYCALTDLWYSAETALDVLNNSTQMGQDEYLTKYRIIMAIRATSGLLIRYLMQ